MASLTGTKIKDTYDSLLKVSDNGALDGTLQTITDGLGNNSALSLSTAGASVGGTLAVSGAATFSGGVSGNVAFDTNTLFVDAANNNVGIGTLSPDISGFTRALTIDGADAGFELSNGGVITGIFSGNAAGAGVTGVGSSGIRFFTSASGATTERMRIHSGGDVSFRDSSANEAFYWDASAASLGIGTTTPSSKFHILAETPILRIQGLGSGEFGLKITDGNASLAGITYNSTTGEQRINGAESYVFQTIYAGGSERMRITSGGEVTINSNSSSGVAATNFRVYAVSGNSFFRLGNNTSNSLNVELTRSDAATMFFANGHTGDVTIAGALSKGSGSFKIDHPLEDKKYTHYLVHSFVESPQANNIYRGKVQLVNGVAQVNLDEVSTMTEGTFVALNREIHTYTSNESDWDAVRGNVDGNILSIECQNAESNAIVSWLVIGERQDQHMMDTSWTDENGRVIVEPLKPEPIEEQVVEQSEI